MLYGWSIPHGTQFRIYRHEYTFYSWFTRVFFSNASFGAAGRGFHTYMLCIVFSAKISSLSMSSPWYADPDMLILFQDWSSVAWFCLRLVGTHSFSHVFGCMWWSPMLHPLCPSEHYGCTSLSLGMLGEQHVLGSPAFDFWRSDRSNTTRTRW